MGSDSIEIKLSKKDAENPENIDSKGKFNPEEFFQNNKLQVVLGGLGVFLLLVGVLSAVALSLKKQDSAIEIIPVEEEQASEIFIHVAGAVEKPGLYKLSSDSRVNDALVSAGGLSAEADRKWFNETVNLAQKLSDGVKLYIPYNGETSLRSDLKEGRTFTGTVAGKQTSIFSQEAQGKININSASVSELDSLSGIGPAYAQRIIDSRPFDKIEDIMKVPGIGEGVFEKIKDKIDVF